MVVVGRVQVEEPVWVVSLHLQKLLDHLARLDHVELLDAQESVKKIF